MVVVGTPGERIARTAIGSPFYPPAVIPICPILLHYLRCRSQLLTRGGATPERRAMAYAAKPLVSSIL